MSGWHRAEVFYTSKRVNTGSEALLLPVSEHDAILWYRQ